MTPKRVITVAPMPPEKSAYALARYSRSADSIRQSVEWVKTHNSQQFLESFYFQYGHQSIADLGHTVLCFEGISELAASEIEDEVLWDGQAKSSRYQDFGKGGFITPPEFDAAARAKYQAAGNALLDAYRELHQTMTDHLTEKLPRPEAMKPEAYKRNIAARAFDVARYLLFWGVPTNVGQVTSIRTLEKQIRRLRVSEFAEVRELGEEIAQACAAPPECTWDHTQTEPLAPTLARHAEPDEYLRQAHFDLQRWAEQNLRVGAYTTQRDVDLVKPDDVLSEIVATLLYPVCAHPFGDIYRTVRDWSKALQTEVLSVAVGARGKRDDLLREFRGGQYCFDMLIDVGAYRDLHRHRRCHQYRQAYSGAHGVEVPQAVQEAGAEDRFVGAMNAALIAMRDLPEPGRQYLLPFGAKSRFLFKMD
ncbi:MAG TPA: FAD-dependent thymidylate synthase, partial [Bryobacteraceae bacterium]|nr:FAD-dependent thymidylate synthase [Bryobacteraceae bacterium]